MRKLTIILLGLFSSVAMAGSITDIVRTWYMPTVNVAPTDGMGFELTVTSANPPAVVITDGTTEPVLITPSANTTLVGLHGIYGTAPMTNLVHRRSLETWAAGSPTGWTENNTAGDGSADWTQSANRAHGSNSALATLTGTTSSAKLKSVCMTTGVGGDLYIEAWARKLTGTTSANLIVVEYDTAVCGTFLANNFIFASKNLSTTWAKQHGLIAAASWHADSSSYLLQVTENCNGGCTAEWDAFQVTEDSHPTDAFCPGDTDADAVCNLVDITDTPTFTAATWQFEATVQSPIDGAVASPNRQILFIPATAGNNNKVSLSWASDVLTLDVWDQAGTQKTSTVAAAGNADTAYTVKAQKSFDGWLLVCWDGTCDATPATGALNDGVAAGVVFGSDGTTGGEVWLDDIKVLRRLR